jgi:hypothetical protein
MKWLLAVPQYAYALQAQDSKDAHESGDTGRCARRLLVKTKESWREVMRKWIADAQEAELEEINGELEDELSLLAPSVAIQEVNVNRQPKKWKPVTLHKLVGASKKPIKLTVAQEAREQEALYMEMLADMEEDTNPDDGAIEIDDDDVWGE